MHTSQYSPRSQHADKYVRWLSLEVYAMTPKEDLLMRISGKVQDLCPELDPQILANTLTIAAENFEITRASTELVVYDGDVNEMAFQKFLLCKRVQGCTPSTIDAYSGYLRRAFRDMNCSVLECSPDHIRLLLAKMEMQNHTGAVQRDNTRRILSSFFTWMRREGHRADNPVESVPAIKKQKEKKRAFSDMEMERLRLACENPRETFIIELMLSTGARVSELTGIKMSDFVEKDQVLVHGKGQKDRYVFLNAKAQVAMEKYMEYRRERFGTDDLCPYLIRRDCLTSSKQTDISPVSVNAIEGVVHKIGKRAGVDHVHPHRFRRTCATWALKRGMPVEQVSLMLGHEKIETTQIYLDIGDDSLAIAHKKYITG